MHFYDISLVIEENMIVWPGNPTPKINQYSSIPKNVTNESLLTFGSHTGSHVNSKRHIQNNVEGSAALPLNSLFGKSKVLDLTNVEKEIHADDLKKHNIQRNDIILLKTKNSQNHYKQFTADYVHIKMDAAKHLVESGVKTLGFDYLSVKKFGEDNDVRTLLINSLTLFEGLNLSVVPEGEYIFAGLPLRIDCDGVPARVILIKDHDFNTFQF